MPQRAHTEKTREQRRATLLEALADGAHLKDARALANFPKSSLHMERLADPEFDAAVKKAIEDAAEMWEAEAARRAVQGVKEPVYQGGKLVGHVQKYSDTLLMFLLNGAMPQKYKYRHEHTGAGGKPLYVPARELDDAELHAIAVRGGNGAARKEEGPPVAGRVH